MAVPNIGAILLPSDWSWRVHPPPFPFPAIRHAAPVPAAIARQPLPREGAVVARREPNTCVRNSYTRVWVTQAFPWLRTKRSPRCVPSIRIARLSVVCKWICLFMGIIVVPGGAMVSLLDAVFNIPSVTYHLSMKCVWLRAYSCRKFLLESLCLQFLTCLFTCSKVSCIYFWSLTCFESTCRQWTIRLEGPEIASIWYISNYWLRFSQCFFRSMCLYANKHLLVYLGR